MIIRFAFADTCPRRSHRRTQLAGPLCLLLGLLISAVSCAAQSMTARADRADGIYSVGDAVTWRVEWSGTTAPPTATYSVKSGGYTEIASGSLQFTDKVAQLQSTFTAPNTLLLEVRWSPTSDANRTWAGAVAAPEQIAAAAEMPEDFHTFWDAKVAELKQVPLNPQLEPANSGRAGVTYAKVTLDNIRGSKVRGQIARPEVGTKFPALLILQYAGVYALQKSWVTDRAAEGWLALNVIAHDLPIDESDAFYTAQSNGALRNYWAIGNDDRDASYYLRMYLSCYQAVEYLKTRDDWDGRTIVVTGASQGGQQALMLAGLHSDITATLVLVPAAGDVLAPEVGRLAGFPNWYFQTAGKDPAKVRTASRYYDPANFAPRITAPVLVALGLRDESLAPPSSILAVANRITAPKEVLLMPIAGHQNEAGSQNAYYTRAYNDWLPALRRTTPHVAFAEQPASRTVAVDSAVSLTARALEATATYEWRRNGRPLTGETAATLSFDSFQPADAGLYTVVVRDSAGLTESEPAIVGIETSAKLVGAATEVGPDIHHANGNTYDQLLLQGSAAAFTADPGQVTRLSFLDLDENIVQVEFSGAGTVTITLDGATPPAAPRTYHQPNVAYVKGHASLVVTGANETTNLTVFAVGRGTASNASLFQSADPHTGAALASVSISSSNGKFGGLRTGNVTYFNAWGLTGVYAPAVEFLGPITLGEIASDGSAIPVLRTAGTQNVFVTGGSFQQANHRRVQASGLTRVQFVDGTNADGTLLPAQPNAARWAQEGQDVTATIVTSP